jgi:hypothetical protein
MGLDPAVLYTAPLPDAWTRPEFASDTIAADGLELRRVGVSTLGPRGQEINGSAADAREAPVMRSYFELLERVATVDAIDHAAPSYDLRTMEGDVVGQWPSSRVFPTSDAPERWRYSRSNGVALHADWPSACRRALWELAERDRILRAWYGEVRPVSLAFPSRDSALSWARNYEWRACSVPRGASTFSDGIEVVAVFGFPGLADAPLVMGFAGRDDLAAAVAAASQEAMQLLAFLWGEPVPDSRPDAGPTPMHHLDHYQWRGSHEVLRRWLDGGHPPVASTVSASARSGDIAFVELTPGWMGGGLRVAKAVSASALPLAFGDAPFGRHLPHELRTHPIA